MDKEAEEKYPVESPTLLGNANDQGTEQAGGDVNTRVPEQVRTAPFSEEQLATIQSMFETMGGNLSRTLQMSLDKTFEAHMSQERVNAAPVAVQAAVLPKLSSDDIAHHNDVTKILERDQRIRRLAARGEEPQINDQAMLDHEISNLQNELEDEWLEAHAGNKLSKVADMSATVAKSWQNSRIKDDISSFPAWHRRGVAYFNAVGLGSIALMDPFKVPKTLEHWELQDRESVNTDDYRIFAQEVIKFGEVTSALRKSDSFSKLNAAFLATMKFKKGLRSSTTAVLESVIDFHTMKSCLLRSEHLSHPAAARQMFFCVFNYFMLNTEGTRLQRLNELTSQSVLGDMESIKNFADRLRAEADVINMMSSSMVVSEVLLFSIFKKAVLNNFEGRSTKYETELRLLELGHQGTAGLTELAERWNTIWLEDKAKIGYPVTRAFQASLPKGRSRNSGNTKTPKLMTSDGKLVCFQFLKDKTCSYGQNCKYSHDPPADSAFNVSEEDLYRGTIDQAFAMGKAKGKASSTAYSSTVRPKHGTVPSHKTRRTNRHSSHHNSKATDGHHGKTISSAYRGAIDRHRKRIAKSEASANLADDGEETKEIDDSQVISGTESDSSTDSDSSSELSMMADTTPTAEVKVAVPVAPHKNKDSSKVRTGVLDSGASVHICGDKDMFVGQLRSCRVGIKCANNSHMLAEQCGEVAINVGDGTRLWLREVLFVPNVTTLISIARLAEDSKINVIFRANECMMVRDHDDSEICTITRQKDHNGRSLLYGLKFTVPSKTQCVKGTSRRELVFNAYHSYVPRSKDVHLLHARYNHACEHYIRKLNPAVRGHLKWCDACVVGGLTKKRFRKTIRYEPYKKRSARWSPDDKWQTSLLKTSAPAIQLFDYKDRGDGIEQAALVNSGADSSRLKFGAKMAWDAKTSPIASVRGNKYGFVGVCASTKITIALLGQHRSDFAPKLKIWLARYRNKYNCYPVQLIFDQGGENMDKLLLNWMREQGIQISFATTKSSNQNAQVERMIRTVWTSMLKLLAHSGVPFQFWCYAFVYATLVGNHIPHRALAFQSPLEKANFSTVHDRIFVWGCEGWYVDPHRMAHEAKAKRGVLLGLDEEIKGWQVLDIETRKVIVSRNVVFNEYRFPFKDHLKPCLIMLKFGTWPKTVRHDVISAKTGIDPVTLIESAVGDDRNGGQVGAEKDPDQDVSAIPKHDPDVKAGDKEEDNDNKLELDVDQITGSDSKEEDVRPVTEEVSNDQISPIIPKSMFEDWTSPTLSPPLGEVDDKDLDRQQTIDLSTPPLGKGASKKWRKFQDNYYYNSTSPRALDFYERKLVQESTGDIGKATHEKKGRKPGRPRKDSKGKPPKPPKPKPIPLTPVPEETVGGEPAWGVRKIRRCRESSKGDGSKDYYVRWEGSWPDEWLHESHLKGCTDLLDDFNKPKRKYQKRDHNSPVRAPVLDVKPLRRSERLGRKANLALQASTEFPMPPDYTLGPHDHWVPLRVSEDELISKAYQAINELVENEKFEKKPDNRREMLKGDRVKEYLEAEEKELYELDLNGTFEVVECPKHRKPIPCRWVYDIKRNSAGDIERFKARLVVQGFRQIEGVDFQNTFSAVSQMRTFRLMVALSVTLNLRITQYDISNAFLHAELDKEIYMTFPPGYPPENPDIVFRLLKGLYGLKQASRLWNKLLAKTFNKAGLRLAATEPGVFFIHEKPGQLCLLNLHVDDYNIATADEELRKKVEKVMAEVFSVKALGDLELFLGIVIEKYEDNDRIGFKLHQKPYHVRAVEKFMLKSAKPAKTPAEASVKLSILDCPETDEKGIPLDPPSWPYMSVGGTLMYSACATRPDISQRVTQLARYNKNPGLTHVKAQKHLLKYLKSDPGKGVIFTRPRENHDPTAPIKIQAFCDSDWAGCSDTRRSTVGYLVMIAGGPVTWKSTLKKTLALSSCEAEFMALSEVAREILWLIRFLDEIGVAYHTPEIYCDSQSAIYWSEDPVQHQRNKHIELKYYFIRDMVGKQLVKVFKINTLYNVADMLTKPATRTMTENLVPAMMGKVPPTLEE